MNNNQDLIDGLRKAADFLESKPELPKFGQQVIRLWAWDKEQLHAAARQLGSFAKEFTDSYFNLKKPMTDAIEIDVTISRDQICKKIVTWDCPDDEALLKLVEHAESA